MGERRLLLDEGRSQLDTLLRESNVQLVLGARAFHAGPPPCQAVRRGYSHLLVRLWVTVEEPFMLLVEQNVNAALSLAERGYLLASGRVAEEGSSAALTSDSIKAAYLGE